MTERSAHSWREGSRARRWLGTVGIGAATALALTACGGEAPVVVDDGALAVQQVTVQANDDWNPPEVEETLPPQRPTTSLKPGQLRPKKTVPSTTTTLPTTTTSEELEEESTTSTTAPPATTAPPSTAAPTTAAPEPTTTVSTEAATGN